ncbi:MAG TPA: 5-formyltetrahydrofolate cyclo-ligase [Anaerovoracaceae bacterium]|nr:5-formyltetrahydrofolate cyclo-ligase [Anaerovoracaceae bacterium]
MTDTVSPKILQRKTGISARKALNQESAQRFSKIIAEKLAAEPIFDRSNTILSYRSFAGEVDTVFFNDYALRQGKRLAFPICYAAGVMVAAVPNAPDGWECGKYGITAPIESRCLILDPVEIDLVIVPCTAFDGQKRMRIGWGAGYYDRYLPRCKNAASIAIAYEAQHIEGLYCDEWDVPLDAIITESNRY